jgi:1,2-diacylglycerol 3-alpha-glucosyltransferase
VPLAFAALILLRARLPEAQLLLVGSGPLAETLRSQVRSEGLRGAVHFAGSVPHEQLPSYYAAADAFMFPSVTETQGLVLAEAFCAGLPVVAIDNPQTRDVFGTHLAGALVADAEGMANALYSLLTDPAQRSAASAHARTAAAAFDAQATAGRVLAVYQAVLANRAGTADMSAFEALFDVVDPGQIPVPVIP